MNATVQTVSSSLAMSIIAKATILIMLALIGSWLARRSRASVRHALLAAAFGALLILPVVAFISPALRIGLPFTAPDPATPEMSDLPLHVDMTSIAAPVPESASRSPRPTLRSRDALLFSGWASGAAIFLLPLIAGLWKLRSLRRATLPWEHGQLIASRLAGRAGISRRVEVLLHQGLSGPMTSGLMNPVIVLPPEAEAWGAEDLERAILHELEHVRRGDWANHSLARVVCAMYWFHPLVWIAWRRLALEAERSCDDAVVGYTEATAYADQLVRLARHMLSKSKLSALGMANRADLSARVGAVLDGRQCRGRAGRFAVTITAATAAVFVLTVAPLKLVASSRPPDTTSLGSLSAGERSQSLENFVMAYHSARLNEGSKWLLAQSAAALPGDALEFEVASVRQNLSTEPPKTQYLPGGRFIATNMPPRFLVASAYDLPYGSPRLTGGPEWSSLSMLRYNIEAKSGDGVITAGMPSTLRDRRIKLMLRALLADRFKLSIRRTPKEQPVYALIVDRNGLNLRKSAVSEDDCNRGPSSAIFDSKGCHGIAGNTTQGLHGAAVELGDIAVFLQNFTDRPVVDKTGLTGLYDLRSDGFAPMRQGGDQASDDPDQPSLSRVLERLGLRMVQDRAVIDMYFVDHIEKPSDN